MRQQHYEFKVIRMRAVRADVDDGATVNQVQQSIALDSESMAVKPPAMRIDVSLRHVTALILFSSESASLPAYRSPRTARGEL